MIDRDTESAPDRLTGHVMLALFAATFALLLCAWSSAPGPAWWALALASWALHDIAGRITRRRGLAVVTSAGNPGSQTA